MSKVFFNYVEGLKNLIKDYICDQPVKKKSIALCDIIKNPYLNENCQTVFDEKVQRLFLSFFVMTVLFYLCRIVINFFISEISSASESDAKTAKAVPVFCERCWIRDIEFLFCLLDDDRTTFTINKKIKILYDFIDPKAPEILEPYLNKATTPKEKYVQLKDLMYFPVVQDLVMSNRKHSPPLRH